MVRKILSVTASALLFALAGCHSYRIVQLCMFSDDDGNVVQISYGKSDTYHVNTFKSPSSGKEMEFKSKLMVKVEVPEITRVFKDGKTKDGKPKRTVKSLCDDETFVAWQCMNKFPVGTMYKTDDEKWMVFVNGQACIVYLREKEDLYLEVFRGFVYNLPEMKKGSEGGNIRDLPRQDKKFTGK